MAINTESLIDYGADLAHVPGCIETPPDFVPFPLEQIGASIAECFVRVARQHADRAAVRDRHHVITYRELDLQSNRLARTLLTRCGAGAEPIALLLDKGIPFFVACLGVWKAGKYIVPLDPSHPPARVTRILEDVTARYLLTDTANQAMGERLAGDGALNLETLELDACGDRPEVTIDPETPYAILYTSGSTGQPKGVIQPQRNILWLVASFINYRKMHPHDRVAVVASVGVVSAYTAILAALLSGAAVYPTALMQSDLNSFAAWLRDEQITFMQCVPSLFRRLASVIAPGTEFSHLRLLVLAGELSLRGDLELFRRVFSGPTKFVNSYGATECVPIRQYVFRSDETCDGPFLPVGYPIPGVEVRIFGPDGVELPPGEIGEIVLCSPYLSTGYWRQPEVTARAFRTDPDDPRLRQYFTGDMGSLQPDGCLTCHGRKDFQVKIRGYRVETAEVELALLELPAVKETIVVARGDGENEQILVAYLVPQADDRPTTRQVQHYLRERLPDYMVPSAIVWLAAMPQTATGKIDRLALPAPERETAEVPYASARDALEHQLVTLWEELLGISPVGIHDDFYELGGHSLLAARLFSRMEKRLGRRLPLATILQASTIAAIADLLRQEGWTPPWTSLIPIQPGGSRRPFFCVHPAGGDVLVFREVSRLLGNDQPFYGLQEHQNDGNVRDTVEEMAEYYLHQLRDFQPEGPYLLGGYSFGGVVAFEMARQLQAQGAQVDLLVLFDTSSPSFRGQKKPMPAHARASVEKYRHMGLLRFLRTRSTSLAKACKRLLVVTLFHWGRLTGQPFPARLRKDGGFLFYKLAKRRYHPAHYPGDLTLFRVTGSPLRPVVEGDLGWGEHIDGAVDIRVVPGHHLDMFSSEHVPHLAEVLRACLFEAQRRQDDTVMP
ncbi:MAG: AMP-binding protein [Armatimonadota bacterium]